MRKGCPRVIAVQFFRPDFNLLSFVKVQNFFIYNLYGSDDEKVTGHRSKGSPTKKEAPSLWEVGSQISARHLAS